MLCGLGDHGRHQKHAESDQPGQIGHMNKYNPASSNKFSQFLRSMFRTVGFEDERELSANDTDDALLSSNLAPLPRGASSGTSSSYSLSQLPRNELETRLPRVVKWLKSLNLFRPRKADSRSCPPPIPEIVEPNQTVQIGGVVPFANTETEYLSDNGTSLPDPKSLYKSVPVPDPPSSTGSLLQPDRISYEPSQNASQRTPGSSTVSLLPAAVEEDTEYQLSPPLQISAYEHKCIGDGMLTLTKPHHSTAEVERYYPKPWWTITTKARSGVTSFTTTKPLYAAIWDSPLTTNSAKTIYFEAEVMADYVPKVGISLGFAAYLYPLNCLPGHRWGSVGVHGIDGKLYKGCRENDQEITTPFTSGDTVGIGMHFALSTLGSSIDATVFVTRNKVLLGSWPLGELDGSSNPELAGLMGDHDIFPVIATIDEEYLEVKFKKDEWQYIPEQEILVK
jgi:hypothetical protein